MIRCSELFLVQAVSSARDRRDLDHSLAVGEDYVVYAATGKRRETLWAVPYADVAFLNPIDRDAVQVLSEMPSSWRSDDELQISAPGALMRHENLIELLADGADSIQPDLAILRAQAGDLPSCEGARRMRGWLEKVRRGAVPSASEAALYLALRLGWCTPDLIVDAGIAWDGRTIVPSKISATARVEARLYWGRELA